jgi:DNA-binding response OmpR family regulator
LPAADRVVALELGADGYIDKPFDLHEFWAQARAIGRRHQLGRCDSSVRRQRGGYRFSGWTLNLSDRSLVDPAGSVVRLSRTIYALLLAFLDAPGRPLPRAYLLQATRAREDIFDRSIDVQVLRLRRALERGEGCQPLIRTELGVGYIFDGPVERLH